MNLLLSVKVAGLRACMCAYFWTMCRLYSCVVWQCMWEKETAGVCKYFVHNDA